MDVIHDVYWEIAYIYEVWQRFIDPHNDNYLTAL